MFKRGFHQPYQSDVYAKFNINALFNRVRVKEFFCSPSLK